MSKTHYNDKSDISTLLGSSNLRMVSITNKYKCILFIDNYYNIIYKIRNNNIFVYFYSILMIVIILEDYIVFQLKSKYLIYI